MPGTYINPAETGFYYLQSRYYDPITQRFLNADGLISTGQGILGTNMFVYCGNNPINRADPSGHYWWAILVEAAKTTATVAIAVCVIIGVAVMLSPPAQEVATQAADSICIGISNVISNAKVESENKAKEKEKDVVIPAQSPSGGTTYYHVTTQENAAMIMAMDPTSLIGSPMENGYVYAWKTKPNAYAIKNSGAHFGVTISFKTNASFINDIGISDPLVAAYGPVVSSRPGPIMIWDVEIVG